MDTISLYLLTFGAFLAIDLAWLGGIAKQWYRRKLAALQRPKVQWPFALTFYALYVVGILLFAVMPGLDEESIGRAVTLGALFGFFTYMTYEFTNAAILKDWPMSLVVVDTLWGVVLTTLVSAAGYGIGTWLGFA